MKRTVVLGVASGIAAYKCVELVSLLREADIEVFVIMTEHAVKMVPPLEFEKASGHKVYIEFFEKGFDYKDILKARKVDHIDLADSADLMIVAPATANIIAKLAHGIADDFLTTTALAVTAPVVVCPSMNVNMWNNPVVQENIEKIKRMGMQIIKPGVGRLACGYDGPGRLADINEIKEYLVNELNTAKSMKGKRILVTAGGTMEKIDDVRYITNKSSGKMGVAIAEECYLRGAEVLLFRSQTAVKPRYLIKEEMFLTADDLYALVKKYVKDFNYFYHTAAVSDFKVQNSDSGKLSSDNELALELTPQVKILERIKDLNPKIKLIGFKAEAGEKLLIPHALKRMRTSRSDLMIANNISRGGIGFESDENEVDIILPNGNVEHLPKDTKRNIARRILDFVDGNL